MADINGVTFTGSGSPTIKYTVAYSINSSGGYSFTITTQLGYSSSYFGTGYILNAVLTVGSYSQTITLKTTDEYWSGTASHTATGTLYCGYSTSARTITFSVQRGDTNGTNGVVSADSSYTVAANQTYTQVSAPTAASFSPTSNFEDSLQVSWSGASAGTNNAITGYQIVPQLSSDNATWTAGTAVTVNSTATSGSYTFDTSGWDYGKYVFFKIRTIGTYEVNSSKYSSYYSTGTIQKVNVTDPVPPAISINADAGSIQEKVKVSWGAGSAGTNNTIQGYSLVIYQSSGTTATGSYTVLETLTYGSTVRSATITLADYATRGKYVKFKIGVTGSYDGTTTYSPLYSDYVRVNYKPNEPTLLWPTSGKTSYNEEPYVKLKCGADNDINNQTYTIKISRRGENTYKSGLSYLGTAILQIEADTSYTAATVDSVSCISDTISVKVNVEDTPWGTGNRISKGEAVKASDMEDLRTAVNKVRDYYGMSQLTWTDNTLIPGETKVKAIHITELQNALDQVINQGTIDKVSWTTVSTKDRIKAAHINQIRDVIEKL